MMNVPMLSLDIRILGPLEINVDGKRVRLGRQQRTLLAGLLLARGRIVSRSRLIDLLWGDVTPRGAEATLRSHVSHLRRALGHQNHEGMQWITDHGYALLVPEGCIDSVRFERLVEQGSQSFTGGDTTTAATLLRAALALWRGPLLADMADRSFVVREATRLSGLDRAARVTLYEAELALGRHAEMVGELEASLTDQPDAEALRRLLAVALYRSGRSEQAARVCADGLKMLYENGLESTRLQELQHEILCESPALGWQPPQSYPTSRPVQIGPNPVFQLPFDVPDFTDRQQEIDVLHNLLSPDATAVPIVCIDGPPGVGKSALAVHIAHQLANRYIDGQLYANLRGAETESLDAIDVLGQFLGAIGVHDPQTIANAERASSRLRSELAGRRVLMLLDNAASSRQIRPLLPGSPTCAVLITSRKSLASIEGIRSLTLDVLPEADSIMLLEKQSGSGRPAAETAAAAVVVRRCGRLPLAIRIAGARLSARPSWSMADLAGRLSDEHHLLNELEIGDLAVRTSFLLSYRELTTESARMFRLLSLSTGPDATLAAAAATADISIGSAGQLLTSLVDAQLIGEPRPNRYRYHDLLRVFGRERAEREESEEDRRRAFVRLVKYYLSSAYSTYQVLRPGGYIPPDIEDGGGVGRIFYDEREALSWLEDERANLVAAVEQAAAAESENLFPIAASLTQVLFTFFDRVSYWRQDWKKINELVLESARRHRNGTIEARTLSTLGIIHRSLGHFTDAADCLRQSLAKYQGLGNRYGESTALSNLGNVLKQTGEPDHAVDLYKRSLAISSSLGDQLNHALTSINLAEAYMELGAYEDAIELLETALAVGGTLKNNMILGDALADLGEVLYRQHRYQQAESYLTRGVKVARDASNISMLATSLACLGDVYRVQGLNEPASRCYRESLELSAQTGDTTHVSRAHRGLALSSANAGIGS